MTFTLIIFVFFGRLRIYGLSLSASILPMLNACHHRQLHLLFHFLHFLAIFHFVFVRSINKRCSITNISIVAKEFHNVKAQMFSTKDNIQLICDWTLTSQLSPLLVSTRHSSVSEKLRRARRSLTETDECLVERD